MFKHVVGVISSTLFFSLVLVPTQAQASSCEVAIAEAQYQIEQKNTQVTDIKMIDLGQQGHRQYPADYPMEILFALNGPGTFSVLSSPAFLTRLSHDIIMSCNPVSLVSFGKHATDGIARYGLVGNKKVERFKCLSPMRGSSRLTPWGYDVCL